MGLFRDRCDRRDLSLKVCWTLAVWLMTQQLQCDVNEADEADLYVCWLPAYRAADKIRYDRNPTILSYLIGRRVIAPSSCRG